MFPTSTIFRAILLLLIFPLAAELVAQPEEDEYYKIITLPTPEGSMLEVGGLVTLPNGSLAASTRRGDVWIIDNPYMLAGALPKYRKFASGLHEILDWPTTRNPCTAPSARSLPDSKTPTGTDGPTYTKRCRAGP